MTKEDHSNSENNALNKIDTEREKAISLFIEQRTAVWSAELSKIIGDEVVKFLSAPLKELLATSLLLSRIFETYRKDVNTKNYNPIDLIIITKDYSFIAFPAAKAFEGYLKELLIKLRLLKKSELKKDPFRSIGKLINSERFENKVRNKRFRHVPKEIQIEWDKSRNYILHYDLDKPPKILRKDANNRIFAILDVIRDSYDAFCGK